MLLDTSIRACKAGIIQLNRVARSISDLEEAMILQSLHRTDGLSQVEIATLLGRDKSWVSRRIMLSERMSDAVRQHLELGLIPVSVARELARLPRGNQPEVLWTVVKRRLGKRDMEKLARYLLPLPPYEYSHILYHVHTVLDPEPEPTEGFAGQLVALKRLQDSVAQAACEVGKTAVIHDGALIMSAVTSSQQVLDRLEQLLGVRHDVDRS